MYPSKRHKKSKKSWYASHDLTQKTPSSSSQNMILIQSHRRRIPRWIFLSIFFCTLVGIYWMYQSSDSMIEDHTSYNEEAASTSLSLAPSSSDTPSTSSSSPPPISPTASTKNQTLVWWLEFVPFPKISWLTQCLSHSTPQISVIKKVDSLTHMLHIFTKDRDLLHTIYEEADRLYITTQLNLEHPLIQTIQHHLVLSACLRTTAGMLHNDFGKIWTYHAWPLLQKNIPFTWHDVFQVTQSNQIYLSRGLSRFQSMELSLMTDVVQGDQLLYKLSALLYSHLTRPLNDVTQSNQVLLSLDFPFRLRDSQASDQYVFDESSLMFVPLEGFYFTKNDLDQINRLYDSKKHSLSSLIQEQQAMFMDWISVLEKETQSVHIRKKRKKSPRKQKSKQKLRKKNQKKPKPKPLPPILEYK